MILKIVKFFTANLDPETCEILVTFEIGVCTFSDLHTQHWYYVRKCEKGIIVQINDWATPSSGDQLIQMIMQSWSPNADSPFIFEDNVGKGLNTFLSRCNTFICKITIKIKCFKIIPNLNFFVCSIFKFLLPLGSGTVKQSRHVNKEWQVIAKFVGQWMGTRLKFHCSR